MIEVFQRRRILKDFHGRVLHCTLDRNDILKMQMNIIKTTLRQKLKVKEHNFLCLVHFTVTVGFSTMNTVHALKCMYAS